MEISISSPFFLDGKRVRGRHIHDLPWLDFQYVNGRLSEQVDYKKGKINGGTFLPNDTDFELDGSRVFNLLEKDILFLRM